VDGSNILKRPDRGNDVNTGPLTQRLLSCLMEENIMVPTQDSFDGKRFVQRVFILKCAELS
jgi:hypothetical protein